MYLSFTYVKNVLELITMAKSNYSTKIYKSWKTKQEQKYTELIPKIIKYLNKKMSVIDIGIGPAWIYDFFEKEKIIFRKIIGIDPDSEIIKPKRKNIEYHITDWFASNEKFDFLICFDVMHLVEKPLALLNYVKKNGYALISVPYKHKNLLNHFIDNKNTEVIKEGNIGNEEVDYFVFLKVK